MYFMYLYTISHYIYFRTLVHCGSPKFPLQLLNKYLLWVLIFVQFLKCAVTGQLEHLACGWLVALKRAVAAGVVSLGLAKWQSDLLSLAEFIVHFSSIEVINWGVRLLWRGVLLPMAESVWLFVQNCLDYMLLRQVKVVLGVNEYETRLFLIGLPIAHSWRVLLGCCFVTSWQWQCIVLYRYCA